MRAAAEDGGIAAAFGVNQTALALLLSGVCAALAGVAGVCIALSYTLAPSQIYAWIGVVFAAVMLGGLGTGAGAAHRRHRHRRQRSAHHGDHRAVVGAAGLVLAPDRRAACPPRPNPSRVTGRDRRSAGARAGADPACWPAALLRVVPVPRLPLGRARDVVEHPVRILRLFLVRPRRVLRRGDVHDRRRSPQRFDVPFLWTLPAAAASPQLLGATIGRRRVSRPRDSRRAFRAGDAGLHVRRRHHRAEHADRRRSRDLSERRRRCRRSDASGASSFYYMGLALALATRVDRVRHLPREIRRRTVRHPRRRGRGRGPGRADVPLQDRWHSAVSCGLAGIAGGIHALFVSYVTAGETFSIIVPLTVVLMSVLGGTRYWVGPAVGAAVITSLLYAFTAGDHAVAGQGRLRRRADRRHPVHAGRRAGLGFGRTFSAGGSDGTAMPVVASPPGVPPALHAASMWRTGHAGRTRPAQGLSRRAGARRRRHGSPPRRNPRPVLGPTVRGSRPSSTW